MSNRKLGRGVALVAAGMSRFGAFAGVSSRDLFVSAFQALRGSMERGLDPADIEALYVGNFNAEMFERQGQLAPILADWLGLAPRPATRVEDACASGGVALRQGILAVASGAHDVVLVGGVEKMTGLPIEQVTDALETAGDALYETSAGFTFPGFYAAIASAYFARHQIDPAVLMDAAIKAHDNAALNENAHLNFTIRQAMDKACASALAKGRPAPDWQDEYDFLRDPRANPPIATPLRLYDCSPVSDGAAALLLVAEERARDFTDAPLMIIASAQASDGGLHARPNLTSLPAARAAARSAYDMAGLLPQDIHLAEVHDCFTIAELIATEDLGFFDPGQGAAALRDGLTRRDGRIPINPSGGLKAKGHPVGASGVAQVVEIWKQLRGEAGERQVGGSPSLALAHNVGGTGQTCAVHIFERR